MCIFNIQAKLPELFKLDVIRKKLGEVVSPTSVVLLQELERFNKLIRRMAVSLNSLQKVSTYNFKCLHSLSLLCVLWSTGSSGRGRNECRVR